MGWVLSEIKRSVPACVPESEKLDYFSKHIWPLILIDEMALARATKAQVRTAMRRQARKSAEKNKAPEILDGWRRRQYTYEGIALIDLAVAAGVRVDVMLSTLRSLVSVGRLVNPRCKRVGAAGIRHRLDLCAAPPLIVAVYHKDGVFTMCIKELVAAMGLAEIEAATRARALRSKHTVLVVNSAAALQWATAFGATLGAELYSVSCVQKPRVQSARALWDHGVSVAKRWRDHTIRKYNLLR